MEETTEKQIESVGADIVRARTGVDMPQESPLEEARRIRDETKSMVNSIQTERVKFEQAIADLALAGRGMGTPAKPKTQAELDAERAAELVKSFKA